MTNNFGDFLYKLRKEKGMTQTELADILHVTNKAVSKWENSETMPETAQLVPISKIFDITIDELLNGDRKTSDVQKFNDDNTLVIIEQKKYNIPKRTILSIASGMLSVLFGIMVMFIMMFSGISNHIAIAVLFVFIAGFVFVFSYEFIILRIEQTFKKSNENSKNQIYSKKGQCLAIFIALGISLCFLSPSSLILAFYGQWNFRFMTTNPSFTVIFGVAVFFVMIICATMILIIFGLLCYNFCQEQKKSVRE
ncbi:MAG: helix-turn-helix domain-containing protein [Firmicutes bacterium]|nr:helix-turn-helix domain-containing protein [Bacillota bacterium]